MSCAILVANLPTLVPPYFCTSHFEEGSIVFWCIFGGVRGGGVPEDEEGLEGSDMDDRQAPDIPSTQSSLQLCRTSSVSSYAPSEKYLFNLVYLVDFM